ncbi:TPA: hypothetical protein N0F65_012484 [Lagenidium giganteum]|uniref:Uncharacterized protein n=1 Tax=Lagenidium giganteum TaxID=4803 RepID=A0AAV2YSS5_9STRA|nr:TPA: hypothetical protein N0F65_012484 [Lagenidium giganteum]
MVRGSKRQLCDELQWEYEVPLLLGNNMGCIYMTVRPGKHNRTKHIENRYHVDLVEKKEFQVRHVGTNGLSTIYSTAKARRNSGAH